jgi:hypothetical protein
MLVSKLIHPILTETVTGKRMTFTREQAYQALASLNPALIFLHSYQIKRLPDDLDLFFGPPEEFFTSPDSQELYTEGRLIPLLDDGQFLRVLLLDSDTRHLVQVSIESPEEIRTIFTSWSQYLADLMIRLGESIDDDEKLRRIAALVQFPHFDALVTFLDEVAPLSYADYESAKKQFVKTISGI